MANNEAKIMLARTAQYANKLRNYRIFLDGKKVDVIADGKEKVIDISAGKHDIYLKLDWCKSKQITLDLKPGDVVRLKCGCRLEGYKVLLAAFYVFKIFAVDFFVYLELC